jgi:glycosyltransferase involved in cell wall biosynthesis
MPGKQIVFVNQSSGYLMVDIINAFRDRYDDRVLFTGFLNPRSQQLDSGVKVEKLAQYNRSSGMKRIWTWLSAFLKSFFLIMFRYRKADLFLVSNPPLTIFLPLLLRNRYSLLVYDIYPDALVAQGMLGKDSVLIKVWERVNRRVMRKAKMVYTITEGMKQVLCAYVPAEKVEVVPVWSDSEFLKPVPRAENVFIAENKLDGKFLVIYSGNLGKTHSVEVITEIAARIKRDDVLFLIIGDGDKKLMLEERIREKQLNNCIMMPWQETKLLPHSLSAADLAVVTLGRDGSNHSIPSKVFSLMSVGAPVLCIADPASELAHLLSAYGIGETYIDTDLDGIVNYICRLIDDRKFKEGLKNNALKAASDFTSANARKFVHA